MNFFNLKAIKTTTMKKFIQSLIFAILMILPLSVFAQIQVTATGGILSQNYSNVSNAFVAINNGTHTGDVTISVNANTTNTFVILNPSGTGFSQYFSIRIIPGVAGPVNIDLGFNSPMFWFNGVKNLTIDGTLPGGLGPLTFRGTQYHNGNALMHFYNDSQNDTIRNCSLQGYSGNCIAISSPLTERGNKNIVISGNNIGNYSASAFPQYGIYSVHTSDSITVSGNYFHDVHLAGNNCGAVYLAGAAANWKINNNKIYYTTTISPNAGTVVNGIYATGIAGTCEIKGNIIGYADTSGSSPAVFNANLNLNFIGINTTSTQNGVFIKNNIIDGFDFTTASLGSVSGSWCGINHTGFYNSYIDSNIIGKTTGSQSIKVTHTSNNAYATGICFANGGFGGTQYVRNNKFGSIEVSGTSNNIRSRFDAINIGGPSTYTLQNNIIGDSSVIPSPNSISVGSAIYNAYSQFSGVNVEPNIGAVISMDNNIIRNCRSITNSDSTSCIGVRTNGTLNAFTMTNNSINSLEAISYSAGNSKVYGLFFNASFGPASTIKGNNIYNLNSFCGTGTRSCAMGMYSDRQQATIDSNFIHDITTNSSAPGILGGAVGMYINGFVSNNRVCNIINTNTTAAGIHAVGICTFGFETRRNMIYDIKTETPNLSTIEGIRLPNFGNLLSNVIALGNGITTDPVIKAINDSSFIQGSKVMINNSIYIGGTQSSNFSNTSCYYTNFAFGIQMYNNILYNTRGSTGLPGSYSGRHYVIKTNFSNYSNLTLAFNNCTADDNGGTFSGTPNSNLNTLSDFKAANSGIGMYCFSSDPEYNNPTLSPPDLTLPMNNKQSNGGTSLNGYFNFDFNNNPRPIPATNRPDMGAYEADYGDPTIDLQEPFISISQLPQDLASNMTRTLTNFAYVSDNKALSNDNAPRIYYKRLADPDANLPVATNTPTDPMGWRYASGTTSETTYNRTYSFVIDYAKMNPGSTLTGDSTRIQYFLTAEDAAGNFNSNGYGATPGTPAVNVISQPTASILNYQLRLGMQGTYYIGAGGTPLFNTYRDFTNYYNFAIITGDINVVVGADVHDNRSCYLSHDGNTNAANYKVTIRPDGNTIRTFEIADTSYVPLNFEFENVKNITFDGRDPNTGTGKYLRFVNNVDEAIQARSVFFFGMNAQKNTIRNCILESNSSAEPIVHFSNYQSSLGNDSNTISNCDFRPSAGTYPGRYNSAIKFESTHMGDSASSYNKIDSCDFVDYYGYAINVDNPVGNTDVKITNNKFHQSFNWGAFLTSIRFQASGTNLIEGNEIYDMFTNQSVIGMSIGDARNLTISKNKINITPSGTSNYLYGIYMINGFNYTTVNILNNQIRIEPTGNSQTPIYGIYDNSSHQSINMHYNTVYVGGQSSGTQNTYSVWRENPFFNSSSWNAMNNIFCNNRTVFSGSAQHYAIGNNNLDYGMNINNNFYIGKSAGFFDDLFFYNRGSGVAYQTWKLQSYNRDVNSTFRVSGNMSLTNFFEDVNNGNLNIKSNYSEANFINGMGTPVTIPSVADDFNGNLRSITYAGGVTDIGSCQVTPSVDPAPIVLNGPFNIGTEYFFFENGRIYGSVIFNSGVQPSSLSMQYYPGVNPPGAHNTFSNSYFKITASGTNSGLDYDIKLAFDERELNNITEPFTSSLGLAKRSEDSTEWNPLPGGIYDNVNYIGALARNLTSFSYFAFTDNTNPLPVELAEFSSSVNKNDVTLKWITVSEINSSKFEIERKLTSSQQWITIGNVKAAGNSTQMKDYKFEDRRLTAGKYKYRLKQIDLNGNFEYFDLRSEVEVGIPKDYKLSQNYPNPFNPTTKIDYDLPFDSKVDIRIYDMTGREMSVLVNTQQTAGYYTVQFNGSSFASGTYFYRVSAKSTAGKDFSKTLKMVLVK